MKRHQQTGRDRLLSRLLGPADRQLTCEECFEQLDRYVEMEFVEVQAERQVRGMRAHFEGCPACAKDHDSLLTFVTQQRRAGR